MKHRSVWFTILSIILMILLAACSQADASSVTTDTEAGGKLNVVATTGQIHDALLNIAGDAVNLKGMLGPGVDPHLYVPTESDVTTLGQANVIFYNGLHLEAQMVRVMTQMSTRGKTVVAVGDILPPDQLLGWSGGGATYDPHIWNDPQLWSQGVETMRDTLVNVDPDNAGLYRQNTEAYLAEITAADEYVKEQIDRIPQDKRLMITAHDAFGYFARAYGLEVAGLQGISTESEASTADVQNLANMIVERQIPAVFVESSVSPRNIEAVQAAVNAQGFEVAIGGTLLSDALGTPGAPEGTYTGMLRYNAKTLADALSK
jgi:manganese/zinc/iron transport system substrate-binding protein